MPPKARNPKTPAASKSAAAKASAAKAAAPDIMARSKTSSKGAAKKVSTRSKSSALRAAPAATAISHKAQLQLCEVFGRAVDARDGRREGHARDAAFYAGLIARELKLPPDEVEPIELAALLHGIGTIAVPDEVLHKSTPLTTEELDIVRTATVAGATWLNEVEGFASVANLVRHQGERWDGNGYPDALSGETIPVGARILAVALRFAAMIRPRADRPAMSVVGGALEFLAYEAGLTLDPLVVRTFLGAMGRKYVDDDADENSNGSSGGNSGGEYSGGQG